MKKYVATSDFTIARDSSRNLEVKQSNNVGFDGQRVSWGGEEFPLPKMSMAIKAGWLVLDDASEDAKVYQPPSAPIAIRGATPEKQSVRGYAITPVSHEEVVVGTLTDHKARMLATVETPEPRTQRPVAAPVGQKMEVISHDTGEESVVISGGFKNAARSSINLSNRSSSAVPTAPEVREKGGIKFTQTNISAKATQVPEVPDVTEVPEAAKASVELPEIPQGMSKAARQEWYDARVSKYPALPSWSFSAHWSKKMEALKDVVTDDHIRQFIYELESAAIQKRMNAEWDLS